MCISSRECYCNTLLVNRVVVETLACKNENKQDLHRSFMSQKQTTHSDLPLLQNWSSITSFTGARRRVHGPSRLLSCWRSLGGSTGSSLAQRGGRAAQRPLLQPGQPTPS